MYRCILHSTLQPGNNWNIHILYGICMQVCNICNCAIYEVLSHDIRTTFRTLRAGRFYHAPLIKKLTGTRRGRQLNAGIIYFTWRDRDTQRAHCYVSAIRRRLSSYARQGAGPPWTGSTGTTVSIFLGRDSEAKELRVELGGHSFIPRIDRLRSQRTTRKTA